jgi:apolipoprotein N-acyltransferase
LRQETLKDFSGFMDSIISFAQNNTVIAIILALGLLYFLYRKPKLFFILLFLGLFLAGLYYMVTSMGGSGSAQKKRFIQQEEKQSD